jgi:transposase
MKTQLKVLTMYNKIRDYFQDGRSKSAISRKTGYDRKTIRKYLRMSEAELEETLEKIRHRIHKLAPYEEFIRQRIDQCRDCSSAQVEDWLKEHYPDLTPVTSRTVFSFVMLVRLKYNLPKPKLAHRQCQAVEELPYGEQAQVDFGEETMYDTEGKRVKVFFMIMVLSRSRDKFIWFTIRYVTTSFLVEAHERAFGFFEGIPRTLVYDQDCTILKDENYGMLVYTSEFEQYLLQRGFSVFMCHKSDPQTKGKVENGVRFVKGNFLKGRTFVSLDILNEDACLWLNRTGNAKVHETTFKIPHMEWLVEREYLKPFVPLPVAPDPGRPYGVRKDNVVRYRGNRYLLPVGTYQGPQTQVRLKTEDSTLSVYSMDGKLLTTHTLASGKGELVGNPSRCRDTSAKLDIFQAQLQKRFGDPAICQIFLDKIRIRFPRYARDQFSHLKKIINDQPDGLINNTLEYCVSYHLFSSGEFQSVMNHLMKKDGSRDRVSLKDYRPLIPAGDLQQLFSVIPDTSNINDYQLIMG